MSDDTEQMQSQLAAAVFDLESSRAEDLARRLLDSGADPLVLIEQVVKPTADEVGDRFRREEFFLPQLMLAGQALEAVMGILLEAAPAARDASKRSVLIGTVRGDVHSIGKNVVAMMLRTGGFEVHDLGVDVDADAFVREAVARDVDLVALSSLLTTTMGYQRDVVDLLEQKGLRQRFKVLVGGGPVTQGWADEIGADGFGGDAEAGLSVARRLVGADEPPA